MRSSGVRSYVLLGAITGASLMLLAAVHLFYLQFLLLVWGAATMAGITIYEKRGGRPAASPVPLAAADRLIALRQSLASVEKRLSDPDGGKSARYLRSRKAALEQELRKLKWTMREAKMESLRRASGREGLRPLPDTGGQERQRREDRRELSHLIDSLKEAEEVLTSEPFESAKARLELIAADLKAHYRLLRGGEQRSRNLGDYGDSWATLTSVTKGVKLEHDVRVYASKKVRARLDMVVDLAESRGLFERGLMTAATEDASRWK